MKKVYSSYTRSLGRARYNPENFTSTQAAIVYIVLLAVFFVVPYLVAFTGVPGLLYGLMGNDYAFLLCFSVLLSQIIIVGTGITASAIVGVNPVRGGGYDCRVDFTPMLFGCVLVMGIQICFAPLHAQFSDAAASLFPGAEGAEASGSIIFMLLYLAMVPTLPCICEELVFRGILMRGFGRFGGVASVIISSAMFALFHGNFAQLIVQFIGGLAIGSCVYLTKNFAVGMVMHFFNNLFALAFGVEEAMFGMLSGPAFAMLAVVAGLVFLSVGIIYFGKYLLAVRTRQKDAAFGRGGRRTPVIVSLLRHCDHYAVQIDASEAEDFKNRYPDPVRLADGCFVPFKKERRSALLPALLAAAGIVLAVGVIIFNTLIG